MKAPYFKPIVGAVYENSNGTKYLCVKSYDKDTAEFISIYSGWYLRALGCHKEDDGRIWWDTSTGLGFKYFRCSYVSERTDKVLMNDLGYYCHICGVELHGEIKDKDIYCTDEKAFLKALTEIFTEYHTKKTNEQTNEFDIPTIMIRETTNENK